VIGFMLVGLSADSKQVSRKMYRGTI